MKISQTKDIRSANRLTIIKHILNKKQISRARISEETGLKLTDYRLRGIITFVSDRWQTEYMFLYTADEYEGSIGECSEGVLEWVDKPAVYSLPVWEGDRIFFRLLEQEEPFFSLKLRYKGETLVESILNGGRVDCNDKGV